MTNEKRYLEFRKSYYRDWGRQFPVFNKAVFGRHYIVPNYRQLDYHNQDACDYMSLDLFFGYLQNQIARSEDHVSGHCISNFVAGLHYGRPTFYLEKELGYPLMKAPLPLDYYTEDINWKWPAFRVYLPKNMLSITRDNKTSYIMYLDITKIAKDSKETIPEKINTELTQQLPYSTFPGKVPLRISPFEGMCTTGVIDFESYPTAYAVSSELTRAKIRDIMAQPHESLKSPWKLDAIDIEFQTRMLSLSINILLFLSSTPLEYEQIPAIRTPKLEGKHLVPGLYPARFIGQSQIRAKQHEIPMKKLETTGRHLPPHWRSGHWRRQHYGAKKLEWIWIQTYATGGMKSP